MPYDPYKSFAVPPKREGLKCPVCREYELGYRYNDEMFIGHCEECRCTYTWYPRETKPMAELDKRGKSKKCECVNCRSR